MNRIKSKDWKGILIFHALFVAMVFTLPAWAADGKSLVKKHECESCHKMTGPAAKTVAEVMKRKAPDLFYAGSKFNKDWLVKFIQKPTLIRPAGVVYLNHIKVEGGKDVIKHSPKCSAKLNPEEANAVADYLMTLKDANLKTGVFKAGKVSKARVRRLMTKVEACNACHRFPKRGGGVSCPTFEGIGSRLNPDWMYSFIKDPKSWDPKIWMAKGDLDETSLQQVVNFLVSFK